MSVNILELLNTAQRFSGVEVAHDIPFSLRSREVYALLDENCAGKSMLVKVITEVQQPYGGEIVRNGTRLHFIETHCQQFVPCLNSCQCLFQ